MAPKSSDQHSWTLRFKKHKTTVLLLVQPTQSFDSIKANLLESIKISGKTEINGLSLPSSPDDLILGVPIDKNDPDQGWTDLEIPDLVGPDKKSKGSAKDNVLNESPMGAGLKDGSVLAFKFSADDEEWDVIMPSYEDEEMPDA